MNQSKQKQNRNSITRLRFPHKVNINTSRIGLKYLILFDFLTIVLSSEKWDNENE